MSKAATFYITATLHKTLDIQSERNTKDGRKEGRKQGRNGPGTFTHLILRKPTKHVAMGSLGFSPIKQNKRQDGGKGNTKENDEDGHDVTEKQRHGHHITTCFENMETN